MRWAIVFVPLCWCIPDTRPAYEDNVRVIGSSASDEGYKIASEILRKSINFSVDPCEDFFEFTCGNWIASHPIPEHYIRYDQIGVLNDKLQKEMKGLLESDDLLEPKSVTVLKALYKKCMDRDGLNRIGAKQLIENVKSIGVWPALEGDEMWKAEKYNLTSLLINVFRRRAVVAFVDFEQSNDKNVRLIQFGRGKLLLNKDSYLNREENGTYIASLKNLLTSQIEQFQKDGGLPNNISKTKKDVDEIIDLEMEIVKIMDAGENNANPIECHLSKMREHMPLVDWPQFFSAVAPYTSQDYLYSDPYIDILDLNYIKSVNELLQSTDPRILTNYVFMLFSRKWSGEMGEKYEDIEQEHNKALSGQRQKKPRWQFCTSSVMEKMSYATTALYIKKASHKLTKEDTLEIADALKEEFRMILNTSGWIHNETRAEALDKLNHMIRQIAYPKDILDKEKLDNYYSNLDVRYVDSFSEMVEKVTRWQTERFFEQLRRVPDRFVIFNSADVHATYSLGTNSLQISAAILQPPYYHHTFPRAMNYGAIGSVIGHEITHGFGVKGRFYNAHGELGSWWSEDMEKEFEQRSQCFIDQYGKIEVPGTGHEINGERTLAENIADHGGLKLAYRHGGQENRIKGLEQFDNEQMFFLGYATGLCAHDTTSSMVYLILNDVHAPDRYRVNQVLANHHEFAAAFHCKVGSAMNPTERCVLW